MSVIDIDWSFFVLTEFIESKKGQLSGKTCLDIGSGSGLHAKGLRSAGLEVTTLDKYALTADIKQGFWSMISSSSLTIFFVLTSLNIKEIVDYS